MAGTQGGVIACEQDNGNCKSSDNDVTSTDILRLAQDLGASLEESKATFKEWGAIGPVQAEPFVGLYVKIYGGKNNQLRLEAKGRTGKSTEARGLVVGQKVDEVARLGAEAVVEAINAVTRQNDKVVPPHPCTSEMLKKVLETAIKLAKDQQVLNQRCNVHVHEATQRISTDFHTR